MCIIIVTFDTTWNSSGMDRPGLPGRLLSPGLWTFYPGRSIDRFFPGPEADGQVGGRTSTLRDLGCPGYDGVTPSMIILDLFIHFQVF
jgi:hypothetical protein